MHDSTVHMNREPMLMPSAPSAKAATRPRASAKPPEAIIGMSILAAAAGISTMPGMSSAPGCPAHSNPSMLMPSTPRLCALTAWRTEVHLCSTMIQLSWNIGRWGAGFDPAVSTILMLASTMTCRYSSYGGGLVVGRMVRLTPNGLSVRSRHLAISLARSRRGLGERGDEAERARVGHGGNEFRATDPLHPAVHDRVLDAERLGEVRRQTHRGAIRIAPS